VSDSAGSSDRAFVRAEGFLERFEQTAVKNRTRVATSAPLENLQAAALGHPDAFMRRRCLDFLDHYASDESATVFARALTDPVEPVRSVALHSIACERCRVGELCVSDVVPQLIKVLSGDPSVGMRHKAIPALLQLSVRDDRARQAVERAAREDSDELIRSVAEQALRGTHVRARKTYERSQKRSQRALPTPGGTGSKVWRG